MNINTIAAISGNDGSAYVTKSEYDALVNTFNEQIDEYIDNLEYKIDGAIANYLTALSNEVTVDAENLIDKLQSSQVYKFMVWSDPGSAVTGREVQMSGNMGGQVDGKQDGQAWSFSSSNSTVSTTNNHVRYFQNNYKGYKTYLGIAYPYIVTAWTLDGIIVENNYNAKTFGTSVSNCKFVRTAPNTDIATVTKQTYGTSAFSTSGWGTKYSYLTHGTSWRSVANDVKKYYEIAGTQLSESSIPFFRQEYRYTNDGAVVSGTKWTINQTKTSNMQFNNNGSYNSTNATWKEDLPYWIVKTENLKWTDMYNYMLVSAGYGIKLYEGLPMFKSSLDGTASFTINFGYGSTAAQFTDFCISSGKFNNTIPSKTATTDKMTSVYPAYDGVASNPQTLKNVTVARARCGDNVNIVMEVKKDKTYYIKLIPRANATTTATPAAGTYVHVKQNVGKIVVVHTEE